MHSTFLEKKKKFLKRYHEVTSEGVERVFKFKKVVPMTSRGILKMGLLIMYNMSHFMA